jgi:disulfide bond formation protein DsbB
VTVLVVTGGVIVASLLVIAGGWWTMWKASARLSPDPVGEARAVALAAAGGDPELAEYIASGARLYTASCIACHGAGGTGVKGNGKPLANSSFVRGLDDEGLLKFIQRGRDPSDPANTTGVGMPAKGGNPALSEDDMLDIISYLRSLLGNATQTAQN